MRFRIGFLATLLACAGQQRGPAVTVVTPEMLAATEGRHAVPRRNCAAAPSVFAAPPASPVVDADIPWAQGTYTLGNLDLFRKTIVQVADYYYDRGRIQPKAMMEVIVAALVNYSGGALTRDGQTLIAGNGAKHGYRTSDLK